MAWQLIYTSALRTLVAGQSGYGTVARSCDLREGLGRRLEQFSYYTHAAGGASGPMAHNPVICAYRILDFRGSRYHVLTRLQDAGLDFTRRTNQIAHHLVFEPTELPSLPPAPIILAEWDGWHRRWQEDPRWMTDSDWGNLRALPRETRLPAAAWQAVTGDAGSAAALLGQDCAAGCTLICAAGDEFRLLSLFAESLQLLDPGGRNPVRLWEYPFTTFLQAEDNLADFRWRGCVEGTPGWQTAQRSAGGVMWPVGAIAAPANSLARLARQGPPKPVVPAPGAAPALLPPTGGTSLRIETRVPVSRDSHGYDATGTRPPAARGARAVTLDLTAPRIWVPALALLLALAALVAAFVWPGLLKTPAKGPPRVPLLLPGERASDSAVLPDVVQPAGSAAGESPQRPEAPLPPPPKEALRQVEAQSDGLPTWLVALESDSAVPLPRISELDVLLGKLFRDDPGLPAAAVECQLTLRKLDLSPRAGARTDLAVNTFSPKSFAARGPSGSGFELDCDDWYNSHAERPVLLRALNGRDAGVVTALFRPADDAKGFSAFRLVALADTRLEPIRLSKALLYADQTTLVRSLCPELLAWIQAFHVVPAGAQWQLRPSIAGSAPRDLLDQLPDAFRPDPGRELTFLAMREKIRNRISTEQVNAARLSAEVDKLQRAIQDDLPIGEMLGDYTNSLASLAEYAKATKRKLDRGTYLEYLRKVFEGHPQLARRLPPPDAKEDDIQAALLRVQQFVADPRREPRFKKLPADYFVKRWKILGSVPEMERKQSDFEQTRRLVSRYEGYLLLIPADLPATPRVSLVLVARGGRRYELVRFQDTPSRP